MRAISRTKWMAAAAVTGLALSACGASKSATQSPTGGDQTITIGEIGSLTGEVAGTYGIPTHDGMELALDQIKKSGYLQKVGVTLNLETKDSGSNVPNAVTIFNQFHSQGVFLDVVATLSTINVAVAPLANQTKTVVVADAGVGTDAEDYDYAVSDVSTPAASLAKYLVAQGKKRVAIIVDGDNEAFVAQAATIEGVLKGAGLGGYASKQTISESDSDFSSVLTNVRNAHPDAVIMATVDTTGGNILRQMDQLGGFGGVTKAGVIGWSAPGYQSGGSAANGVVFPTLWAPGQGKTDFESDWNAAHPKTTAGPYQALGDEMIWLYAVAIHDLKAAGKPVTADTVADELPAASTSKDLAKYAPLVDFSVARDGTAKYPGAIATYGDDGTISAVKQ